MSTLILAHADFIISVVTRWEASYIPTLGRARTARPSNGTSKHQFYAIRCCS